MPLNQHLIKGYTWLIRGLVLTALLMLAGCGSPAQQPAFPVESDVPPATSLDLPPLTAPPNINAALPPGLLAYARQYRFNELSLDEGLSQSVVLDILQDQQGFLWFATQDGLNRYDGYQFKIFKNDPEDANSPSGNYFSAIDLDDQGRLWAGTFAGLNCYDPVSGQWTRYQHDPEDPASLTDDNISNMIVASDGTIWVGTTNNGLNQFDPATGKAVRYRNDPNDPHSLGLGSIFNLFEDHSGTLWVGTTEGGLNRLDKTTGTFTRYLNDPNNPDSLSHNGVQIIYQDRQEQLWVGTADGGLNLFNPHSENFTRYLNDPNDPASLSQNSVFSIFEDSWGQLWVGTAGGLNILDRDSGKFTRFFNDPEDEDSLPNNQIYAMLQDRSGMLWYGTYGNGAASYDPYKDKFLHISVDPNHPEGLSSNFVFALFQDAKEQLWIGTYGGGLNRLNLNSGEWTHYTAASHGLADDSIFAIHQDQEGFLWLGGGLGLNRFDPASETNEIIVQDQVVLAIQEDPQGVLWFGTGTSGLGNLDRQSGQVVYYRLNPDDPTSLSDNAVMSLRLTGDVLWAGTAGGGLNRMDPSSGKFTRYQHNPEVSGSLSNDTVLSIVPSQDGKFLWLGTGSGLNKLDLQSGTFAAYREKDGLPNDMIYTIVEDRDAQLWLSTNRGVARFDPRAESFMVYDPSDGLQANEYNQGAAFINQDGLLFLGGINGFNVFDPALVQDNAFVPPVVITGFKLYNQPLTAGPDSKLSQPIESSSELKLAYTDDFFEIEFAALHFSTPEQNQYAFKFEGLDEDWNYIGNRNFISFTQLPPGDYSLRIKGSNSDGVWNEEGTRLRILIPPPFWQTTWFRLLLTGGVLALLGGVVYFRIRAIENQRRKLEVLVDERTLQLRETMHELEHAKEAAEAANRAKSVFLANMSHEFRTPLNAILGFTQIMTRDKQLKSDQRDNVDIIHRSSEHLLGLINDVLDMSKIEAGRTVLVPKAFDLLRMLVGLGEMFQLRAEKKGIDLKLEISAGIPEFVKADEGKLRQVLLNLLGNAVKFTDEGQVSLRVFPSESGDYSYGSTIPLTFEIEDTGTGMTPREIETIFDPFTQASAGRQSQEGTGLGLAISQQYAGLMGSQISVESRLGSGSTFRFTVPLIVAAAEDLETPQPTQRVIGLEAGQPEYRILIVDDQEVNRQLLVKLLTPIGFQVREAENGKAGLEVWQDWQPQLIFMDMRMPVMDGYEATRQIKATTRGQATIIIALTASGLEEEKSVILSEGCDDYLRKPFREEEFFNAIGRHLGVRYIFQEIESAQPAPARYADVSGVLQTTPSGGSAEDIIIRLAAQDGVWLEQLERATVLGDEQSILQTTAQISPNDARLVEHINALALRFDHDQILALIRQAHHKKEGAS